MCGVSGVYFNKKKKKNELEESVSKMTKQQVNRGPDDSGIFVDVKNNIAFGHNRLSIIDLSKAGKQPMKWQANRKRQIVITFNGEIYNFLELKKDLEKRGYKFKTKTDTEVILAFYAEYGEKSFAMLRGMFAFGLWDGENQKLFLVKDRYGVKPLYYYSDNEKLVFASTVKALSKSGLFQVEKNPQAMIGFLLFGSVPLPLTTVKNVFAAPAGHYIEIGPDGDKKTVKYYDLLDAFLKKSDDNFDTAKEKIHNLLKESVGLHLISDAPLGVFLSGGLDSSAIAALAAKQRKNPITTLSIVFDEPEFSEQKYQRIVAQKIGSNHREIKITKKDFEDSFDEIFEAMDQPTIDGVNTFFIAKAAKQAGLKAVLSGLGADEIFCGYSHFKKAEMIRKIQNLPKFVKFPLLNYSITQLLNYSTNNTRYSKLNYFAKDDILSFYLGVRGLFSPQETAKILDINLNEVNNFICKLNNSLISNHQSLITKLHPVDLLSYLELKFYLQNQLLKDTDFMSMRHSVEVRVPFLDHPLVEYLSSLPPQLKLNMRKSDLQNIDVNFKRSDFQKLNKQLLAVAVSDLLPQEIFIRPKMGFTFPFEKWLKEEKPFNGHWSRHWAKEVLKKQL